MNLFSGSHQSAPASLCAHGTFTWARVLCFAVIAAFAIAFAGDDALLANPERDIAAASHADQSRELPANNRLIDRARRRLPAHFSLHTSACFAMLSDLTGREAATHGHCMERAYEEFLRFARDCGLQPRPLEHKLISVCFRSDEEYRAFALAEDGPAGAAISGYYSPRSDLVVMHLGASRGTAAARPRMVAQAPTGTPVLHFESQPTGEALTPADEDDQTPDHHQHLDCSAETIAKRVHETVHQLTFHTRIMDPAVQYPPWICEGLATAFETEAPGRPFGPDVDFAPRREVFQRLLAHDDLWRLRHLVSISRVPADDRNAARIIYHQSYALVTWLYRHRREQFRDYLNAMLREPAGPVSPARNLQLFEQAFGEVEAVEHEWLDHELDALQ